MALTNFTTYPSAPVHLTVNNGTNFYHDSSPLETYPVPTAENAGVKAMLGIDPDKRAKSKIIPLSSDIIVAWRQLACPSIVAIGDLVVNHFIPCSKGYLYSVLVTDLMDISETFVYKGNKFDMRDEAANWLSKL